MKKLMKVKLINWHSFTHEEFEVFNNTLITGENGTGKSTLLDAMQYVLTAGKGKFNVAASDIGKRNVESYIRYKTGEEGNEFERKGDVTSYIALEFYDEKTLQSQVIGVVLELQVGAQLKNDFFQIPHKTLDDIEFIQNNIILPRQEFKSHLVSKRIQAVFKDTKKGAASLFSTALGVKPKYFELVTKALAFKAIDDVYRFIMDFLLKEDNVNIEDLRQSIRSYQGLLDELKKQQEQCDYLKTIDEDYALYLKQKNKYDVLDFSIEKNRELQCLFNIKTSKENLNKYEHKKTNLEQQLLIVRDDFSNALKVQSQIDMALNENTAYQLKKQLNDEYDLLKKEAVQLTPKYKEVTALLQKEAKLMKMLRIQSHFINLIQGKNYEDSSLFDSLNEIKSYLYEKQNELSQEKTLLEKQALDDTEDYNKLLKKYNSLKNNKHYYNQNVYQLITLLKKELFLHYGEHIEVKPLCEYIEVEDETWRNAIEGYLNTQRFDLIIEPRYFEYALKVYEEYKDKHGIYGVGIVNVSKLKKYENAFEKGSLFEKITCHNTYAKWYATMLLGKVICVYDVKDLKNYHIAITPTCMLYKNYTVKALHPKVYQTPFIGLKSIEIQKETIKKELKILKEKIGDLKSKRDILVSRLNMMKESKVEEILVRINVIQEYKSNLSNRQRTKEQLDALVVDDSLLALEEELQTAKQTSATLKNELDKIQTQIAKIQVELDATLKLKEESERDYAIVHEMILDYEREHLKISKEADERIIKYRKRYYNDFTSIQKQLEQRKRELELDLHSQEIHIHQSMHEYNYKYGVGLSESIDAIDDYLRKYHILRDAELVKQEEKARVAKIKSEESFQTSFISGLNEKIENAKRDIRQLNKGLEKRNFNGERYEFIVDASKEKEFRQYYHILQSGKNYHAEDLFSETLEDIDRKTMNELFQRIASLDNDRETERILQKYTDYRNYLDYDIKIHYPNGNYALFSKVNREKSGGETQTPFYVIMAASFEQIIQTHSDEDFGCVVIFDEAFNNMDEQRIQEMLKFYNELNIQTLVAVPPSRASTIMPYVDTNLLVIRENKNSFVEVFRNVE